MKNEKILVLDFGGQYNQLIARRVRECSVYCEVHPYSLSIEKIKEYNPKGIILTGGPNSVYASDSPICSKELFELGIPVLGICYGSQLMAHLLGGKVASAPVSEYGKTEVEVNGNKAYYMIINGKVENVSYVNYVYAIDGGESIYVATASAYPVNSTDAENSFREIVYSFAQVEMPAEE